jgi:pimeloyl-ACP methyl ester carboxylesterase
VLRHVTSPRGRPNRLGTESSDWATRSTEAYADVLPNAEKRPLEGQGHGANVSAPELLAGELTRFLSK